MVKADCAFTRSGIHHKETHSNACTIKFYNLIIKLLTAVLNCFKNISQCSLECFATHTIYPFYASNIYVPHGCVTCPVTQPDARCATGQPVM